MISPVSKLNKKLTKYEIVPCREIPMDKEGCVLDLMWKILDKTINSNVLTGTISIPEYIYQQYDLPIPQEIWQWMNDSGLFTAEDFKKIFSNIKKLPALKEEILKCHPFMDPEEWGNFKDKILT